MDMADQHPPFRVILADDHVTVRHGLRLLIDGQPDMKVVAEASDGATAIQRALDLTPDVVVMDISMPGMNGLVATRTLKQARPNMAIMAIWRCVFFFFIVFLLVRVRIATPSKDSAGSRQRGSADRLGVGLILQAAVLLHPQQP